MDEKDILWMERLNRLPEVKELFVGFIDAIASDTAKLEKVDDMESFLFYKLRDSGQILFSNWAKEQAIKKAEEMNQNKKLQKHGKKKPISTQSMEK